MCNLLREASPRRSVNSKVHGTDISKGRGGGGGGIDAELS